MNFPYHSFLFSGFLPTLTAQNQVNPSILNDNIYIKTIQEMHDNISFRKIRYLRFTVLCTLNFAFWRWTFFRTSSSLSKDSLHKLSNPLKTKWIAILKIANFPSGSRLIRRDEVKHCYYWNDCWESIFYCGIGVIVHNNHGARAVASLAQGWALAHQSSPHHAGCTWLRRAARALDPSRLRVLLPWLK